MKKLNLSLVTVLAMSTFAIAGGDIAPVEPEVETPMVVEEPANDNGFYLGLAYSATAIDIDGFDNGGSEIINGDGDADSFMVQAGYKFNQNIALEGRYWNGNNGFDAWGLYLKPMYPVSDAFDIYGLVGYGSASAAPDDYTDISLDESEFQWGLGASYSITNNFAVFVDYVELYNSDVGNVDWSLDTWNLGVTYQF